MTTTPDPRRHQTTGADLDPLGEAPEADVAEQRQGLDGSGTSTEPEVSPGDADEADALEQGATVTDGTDEDEGWPRAGEGDVG